MDYKKCFLILVSFLFVCCSSLFGMEEATVNKARKKRKHSTSNTVSTTGAIMSDEEANLFSFGL